MINIFRKKTKWIPLVTYHNDGSDRIVFVRKIITTGLLEFKTKTVTPYGTNSYNFPVHNVIDIKEQFNKIINDN